MFRKLSFVVAVFPALLLGAFDSSDFCVPEAPCDIRFQTLREAPSSIEGSLEKLVQLLNGEHFFEVWKANTIDRVAVDMPSNQQSATNTHSGHESDLENEWALSVLKQRINELIADQALELDGSDTITQQNTISFLVINNVLLNDLKQLAQLDEHNHAYQQAQKFLACFLTFLIHMDKLPGHRLFIDIKDHPYAPTVTFTMGSFQYNLPAKIEDQTVTVRDPISGKEALISADRNSGEYDLKSDGLELLQTLFPEQPYWNIQTWLPFEEESFTPVSGDPRDRYEFMLESFLKESGELHVAEDPVDIDPNMPEALRELQQEINQRGWNILLNLNTPRPSNETPIDKEAAEEWIQAHEGQRERALARRLVDKLRYVSFKEFTEKLAQSTHQFNKKLSSFPSSEQKYLMLILRPELKKSDRWVASMAFPELTQWPEEILPDGSQALDYLRKHPEIRHIVIFDDASYSGSQVGKRVRVMDAGLAVLNQEREENGLPPRQLDVHVIIPFLKVSGLVSSWPRVSDHLAVHEYMQDEFGAIGNLLSREERPLASAMWANDPCFLQMAWIVFQHKVADQKSLPWKIIEEGRVGITEIKSTEKQLDEIREYVNSGGLLQPEVLRSWGRSHEERVPFVDTNIVPPYK